ncbi:MAG: FG-GAP repeat protein [Gammaproteobacteria bacterium]|nr:FG-GAP repeat protein [Gammaproteobacteria bacterium]
MIGSDSTQPARAMILVTAMLCASAGCSDSRAPDSTATAAASTLNNIPFEDVSNDALIPPLVGSGKTQLQRLTARTSPDSGQGDFLGSSLASNGDGNVLVSGAPGRDVGSVPDSGAVTVMFQVNGQWWFDRELTAELPQTDAGFGHAVAVSQNGQLIAATAPHDNVAAEAAGAVYLFERFGEGWVGTTQLVSPTPANSGRFGTAVVLHPDGETLFVSEPAVEGSVHIFRRQQDLWSWTQTLKAPHDDSGLAGQQADGFGTTLDIAADGTLVVGAPDRLQLDTDQGFVTSGAVYTFRQRDDEWQSGQILTPSRSSWTHFGKSIAVAGDGSLLLVSVLELPLTDMPLLDKAQIQVQVYRLDADHQWKQDEQLLPAGAHSEVSEVALLSNPDGDRIYLALTNPGRRDNTLMQYDRIGDGWLRTALLSRPQAQPNALGHALALAPDADRLLVTAPDETVNERTGAGAIYTW